MLEKIIGQHPSNGESSTHDQRKRKAVTSRILIKYCEVL
jgi:hypothetical protein